ncbi:MAG TPA: class I SAM-dependent methyltransferase [Candidatus Dormibacteraeota bacterium]|nr:class I SAM-dependent methyltransferase [Candidatus Dormibacteraeota bacterium]
MTFAPRTHDLHGIPATLFLTLAARALAPIEAPELGLADHKAEQILARLEIDPRQFALNANEMRAVVLRSQWFAQTTRSFFERYPEGLCINVGCGLNASFEQVADAGGGRFTWIDLDLPEVIAIRRQFFVETARRRIIEGDITKSGLFSTLPWGNGQPALIIAEGLLYYLKPAQVEAFLGALAEASDSRRAQIEIAFDYVSRLGAWIVGRRPAHQQLGTAYAWTLRRPGDLLRRDPRLELVEDTNVFMRAMGPWVQQVNAICRIVTGGELGGCAHLSRSPNPR